MQALMNALTQANPGKPMNPAAQPQQQPTGVMPMRPAIMPPQNTGVVPPHQFQMPNYAGAHPVNPGGFRAQAWPQQQRQPQLGGLIGLGDGRRR